MSSENFSFTKKPIYCTQKRRSVISDIIPNESSSNNYTTSKANGHGHGQVHGAHKYTDASSARTFSSNSGSQKNNIIKSDSSPDDPLLDYDEQIRAPKFQTKKSLDDIGSASNKFESNDLMDKSSQKQKNRLNKRKNSKNNKADNQNGEILDNYGSQQLNGNTPRPTYQPAKVDISKLSTSESSSLPKQTTSTSLGDNLYNIDQYLINSTSSNIIYNNDAPPSESTTRSNTATTTPLSSKKNSNESIYQFTSKKTPKFSMAPLRPIDDPKTPNYLPCVLRPNSYNPSGMDQQLSELTEDTMEQPNALSHEHWKPNNSSSSCFDCGRQFSIMYRRHHCRKCGEIFCANCLLSKARLTFDCKFDINGVLAKVCFACGRIWSNFIIENFKQVDNYSLYPDFKKRDVITPENDHHHQLEHEQQQQQQQQNFGDKRGVTVPADWSWSSF